MGGGSYCEIRQCPAVAAEHPGTGAHVNGEAASMMRRYILIQCMRWIVLSSSVNVGTDRGTVLRGIDVAAVSGTPVQVAPCIPVEDHVVDNSAEGSKYAGPLPFLVPVEGGVIYVLRPGVLLKTTHYKIIITTHPLSIYYHNPPTSL